MEPITRAEAFMAKAGGQDAPDIEPITRKEIFLSKAAGNSGPDLVPQTREEWFLSKIKPVKLLPRKEINFIDFDGRVIHAFTREDAKILPAMPKLPTNPGLTATGWTKTLEEVKEAAENGSNVDVGATYETDDKSTRIYVHFEEGRCSPYFRVANINGTVTVDFGDGSDTETKSGAGQTNDYLAVQHTFAPGDYVIKVIPTDGTTYVLSGASQKGSMVLQKTLSGENLEGYVYKSAIRKVEMGVGASLGGHAFADCYSLESIILPSGITEIPARAFSNCSSLKSISIPQGVTIIDQYAFYSSGLESASIPGTVTTIGVNAFQSCKNLLGIFLPSSISSIGSYALASCQVITKICIPSELSAINSYLLQNCYGLSNLRFASAVAPPASSSTWYSNIPTDCIIEVPRGSLAAYTSATNYPGSTKYTYVEFDPE